MSLSLVFYDNSVFHVYCVNLAYSVCSIDSVYSVYIVHLVCPALLGEKIEAKNLSLKEIISISPDIDSSLNIVISTSFCLQYIISMRFDQPTKIKFL